MTGKNGWKHSLIVFIGSHTCPITTSSSSNSSSRKNSEILEISEFCYTPINHLIEIRVKYPHGNYVEYSTASPPADTWQRWCRAGRRDASNAGYSCSSLYKGSNRRRDRST